jgi:DNA polymerase-3 subunit epsilon
MACSMLAARRVFPDAPNHRLATLVQYCGIKTDGVFHRALADAEMTGRLWLAMLEAISSGYGIDNLSFDALCELCRTPKAKVGAYFAKIAGNAQWRIKNKEIADK